MTERVINAEGLQCPGPIVKLFEEARKCSPGEVLVIQVTDYGFKKDVVAWCKKTGNELLDLSDDNGVLVARIRKS
ncbi:MAG: sulfurtransferase TusA family protein [Bacillota bacterium]|jgi:TusA-related sulfurtransferase